MSNPSLFSPQVGYNPPVQGQANQSQIVLGKDVTASWEAVGFGPNGRPDYLENLVINFTKYDGSQGYTKQGSITLNVADLVTLATNNPNVPANLTFGFQEIDVCASENGTSSAKKMIIIASQVFDPPS